MRNPYNVPNCFIESELLNFCNKLEHLPKEDCYFDFIADNVDRLAETYKHDTQYLYQFESYFNECLNMQDYFGCCTTLADYFEETLAYAIKEIIVCDNLTNICFNMLNKYLNMENEVLFAIAKEMSVDDCPQDLIERAVNYARNS